MRITWDAVAGAEGYFVRWTMKEEYIRAQSDPLFTPEWITKQYPKTATFAPFLELGVFAERDAPKDAAGYYIDPITGSKRPSSGNSAKTSALVFQVAAIGANGIAGEFSAPIYYGNTIAPPANVAVDEKE